MSAHDLELAREFLTALAVAARTGEREGLYPFLAADVEWVTPQRDLTGIDAVHDQLTWLSPPENLDSEFGEPELTELGDGRILTTVRQTYRVKSSGDFAYVRDRQIDLTLRDGKIRRYEMRVVG